MDPRRIQRITHNECNKCYDRYGKHGIDGRLGCQKREKHGKLRLAQERQKQKLNQLSVIIDKHTIQSLTYIETYLVMYDILI